MTSSNSKQKIFSWLYVGLIAAFVVAQLVIGAMPFNWEFLITFMAVMVTMLTLRWLKNKSQKEIIKDERYMEIARKTNALVFGYTILAEILGYFIFWTIGFYYPNLQIVAYTLIILVVAQSLLSRIIFKYFDQKAS